ncbi:MAG TPA: tetratricopeptide repeat protein [Bryobacteraceae bacterium]|nr:tetratricopeptide repeat protein [Bryobacteraceae bacterium]
MEMDHAMSCEQIERDEIVEKYVAGTLAEDAAEAFEEHYFRCAACLARLETVQNAIVLMRSPLKMRRYSYAGLAMAAGLVIALTGALVWKFSEVSDRRTPVTVARQQPPPQNPWAELGRFEAPVYREARLRGAGDSASEDFQQGMAAYQQGNYAKAVSLLQKAAKSNPREAQTMFFAGISLILAGNTAEGLETLRRVDALGLTPYQEESRFYQAKALLQQGDSTAARNVLTAVVAMHGDWETQAKELLAKLAQ